MKIYVGKMKHLKIYILTVTNETQIFQLSSNFRVVMSWCSWCTQWMPDLELSLYPSFLIWSRVFLNKFGLQNHVKIKANFHFPKNKWQLSLVMETLTIITEFQILWENLQFIFSCALFSYLLFISSLRNNRGESP